MKQRQQHLNWVVASREELAAVHLQVSLLRGNEQDPPFAALVGIWIVRAIEVGLGWHVLREREWRWEPGICFSLVGDGLAVS